jgi:hypothetical protein
MSANAEWQDFGLPPGVDGRAILSATASRNGTRTATMAQPRRWWRRQHHGQQRLPKDRAVRWLRNAMIALGVLAVITAVVSFAAQYQMVLAYKGVRVIAALEAGIPDVSAVVFASLGIALALHGRRAVRARLLNVGAVATSITMNWLAAAPGWRGLAIWVMPPIAYALASDTAIGVIRAWTIARARELREDLAEDEATPLAILAGALLWFLRLALAPWSTLTGFRRWVVEECPSAPGRQATAAVARAETARAIEAKAGAEHSAGAARAELAARTAEHEGGQQRVRAEAERQVAEALAEAAEVRADAARHLAQIGAEMAQVREDTERQVARALADAAAERDLARSALEAQAATLEGTEADASRARDEAERAHSDEAERAHSDEAERAHSERDLAVQQAVALLGGAAPPPARHRRGGGGRGRGPGRDWDALSDATRRRYTGAGIDRAAYESGADISAARGHRDGGAS